MFIRETFHRGATICGGFEYDREQGDWKNLQDPSLNDIDTVSISRFVQMVLAIPRYWLGGATSSLDKRHSEINQG
jgi:hypothetical protein